MYHHTPQQAARTRDVPSSSSSSSLSSSFSSSAASSMLHASSLSEASASDYSSSSPSFRNPVLPTSPSSPFHHTLPSGPMGQTQSRGPALSPGSTSSLQSQSPSTAGSRLKRAFAGRRKKSEDAPTLFAHMQKFGRGKERERADSIVAPALGLSSSLPASVSSTKQVLTGKKTQPPTAMKSPLSSTPIPPPKPAALQVAKTPSARPSSDQASEPRLSPMPLSTSMNPPSEPPRGEEPRGTDQGMSGDVDRSRLAQEKENLKEDWRKSDSTMTAHATARPGAYAGSRTPRPVSMAESINSTRTVMPMNKRLSALVTDAEYATPEEGPPDGGTAVTPTGKSSPSPSVRARNRRSMSLNLGPAFASKLKAVASEPSSAPAAGDRSDRPRSVKRLSSDFAAFAASLGRDSPTITKAVASRIIGPPLEGPTSSTSVQERLAAWNAAAGASPDTTTPVRTARPPPPAHPHRPAPSASALSSPPSFRQTAISMTSGLAPAAGLAMGFGKRAVSKVGRAWGNRTAGTINSGYNSASSSAPSAYAGVPYGVDELGRSLGNHSGSASALSHGSGGILSKGKARRTPNAPSSTWSINSTGTASSMSDSDAFSSSTASSLGKCVRDPLRRTKGGAPVTGLVFKRDLATCVRETRFAPSGGDAGSEHKQMPSNLDLDIVGPQVLEHRLIPVIVLRCAQHLLKWGIEEEGLFRINGRSSQISKLRAQFDTGADYDLSDCAPGDLDPHAVSSLLKAYLRELPEPILTSELSPYFEAALATESRTNEPAASAPSPPASPNPKLGPPMMRKPPSLSTLAMPNFSGMRPHSAPFLDAVASLILRLPQENRDLLRTVTDLIKQTAKRSKITKMPLSNLLLVFCPSLHMSPPLLRVLCDGEVWNGPSQTVINPVVLDIKPEPTPVLNIASDNAVDEDDGNDDESDDDSLHDSSKEGSSAGSKQSEGAPSFGMVESRGPLVITAPGSGVVPDDGVSSSASDTSFLSQSSAQSTPMDIGSAAAPCSSAESFGPSTPAEEPILSRPSVPDGSHKFFANQSPTIAVPSESEPPLPTPRQARTAEFVQFPSVSPPVSPTVPRRSTLFLSLPSVRTDMSRSPSPTPSPQPSPRAMRLKRPSLTLLFSKRSASPLPSSTASASTPYLSSITPGGSNTMLATPAPLSTGLSTPPRLDMPILSSPIRMGMGVDDADLENDTGAGLKKPVRPYLTQSSTTSPSSYSRSTSTSTGKSYSSALSLPLEARSRQGTSSTSVTSPAVTLPGSFDTLRTGAQGTESTIEDWTSSVLIAAEGATSEWNVKEAVRALEERQCT